MKYESQIKDTVSQFDPDGINKYFLFGSFVKGEKFHDIDLGVVGNSKSQKKLSELEDKFYDSLIPHKVDVVDMDEANPDFRERVLNKENVVWLELKKKH